MVRVTMIARLGDGLPLCEGTDVEKSNDLDVCKRQAKTLIRKLGNTNRPEPKLSYESGPFLVHYMIEGSVVYVVVCDRKYPKKLAFKYLDEIRQEFENLYRGQVDTVVRPYAFIKFDTFIQKTRKLYMDTRAQRNMMKLSEELSEVQQIMTRNIQEVLGQGEKLDHVSRLTSTLAQESSVYSKKAKKLSRQALIKKYTPLAVIVFILILVMLWRFW
uniref:Vesicle-trafficking protein SEC22b n=1 Tax=Picocystis salinarum TaxID=88271 RepID=A0A6U9PZC7_9CHLO